MTDQTEEGDTSKPLIIYHAGCYDGFTAAWVTAEALGGEDTVELKPMQYGDGFENITFKGRDVYVVDFSFSRMDTLEVAAIADRLTVLDHHVTAQEELEPIIGYDEMLNLEVIFDMERSGAGLAWDYFHPDEERPALVDFVEDRDLWNWRVPHSEAINAWIGIHDFEYQNWRDMHEQLSGDIDSVLDEAEAIITYRDRLVKQLASNAGSIKIKGHKVPAVNSAVLQSEVGNYLMEEKPERPFACIWYFKRGKYIYSLRSTDQAEDVGAIAKALGGGGHRNSAGFVLSEFKEEVE